MKAVILEGDSVNPGDISWEPVTRLCETKIYGNTSENEKWERINDCEIVLINKTASKGVLRSYIDTYTTVVTVRAGFA